MIFKKLFIRIYIINPQVRLSVGSPTAETVWPTIMKFCVRNLHLSWRISIEKKFGKIEQKKFRNFSRIFFKIFFSGLLSQNYVKMMIWRYLGIFRGPHRRRPSLDAIRRVSQNSRFQNLIFHKIHLREISIFTKFTFLKHEGKFWIFLS